MVLAAIAVILVVRLATLNTLAVTDNTEARHAEIGWQMFRSGDWVTPRFHLYGRLEPFLGKPPLSFWMTALSFHVFGVSEWSSRLPNWLLGSAVIAMTVLFGRKLWSLHVGLLAALVLASTGLFFVLSGACILDMALAAAVSLAMMTFALFIADDAHAAWWGRAFFFALGLGCLAKGPVAVVLVGIALAAWLTIAHQWKSLCRLPWISGSAIAVVVTVPWFLLAERANPGFLRYFLINEHILRYLVHDYGDRYGGGHTQPYGASWVMLAIAFLPWTPLLVRYAIETWRQRRTLTIDADNMWLAYAVIWGLTPALFFTLCRQILVTYVLPGFPGLALASAVVLSRWLQSDQRDALLRSVRFGAVLFAVTLISGLAYGLLQPISLWALAGLTAMVTLFVAMAWHGHKRNDAVTLLAAVGMGMPLLISVALSTGRGSINDTYSAKTIVARVTSLPERNRHPVVLPMGDEYSANFYVEACHDGRITRHEERGASYVLQRVAQSPEEVFVFKRKHWESLDPNVRRGLEPIVETGHWVACGISEEFPPAPALTLRLDNRPR